MAKEHEKVPFFSFRRLRNGFITGFLITGPIGITIYIVWAFIRWVDGWVKPLIPEGYNPETYLPFALPGLGVLVAFLVITLVGLVSVGRGRQILMTRVGNLFRRMPLVGNVFSGLKQIFDTVLEERGDSFTKAGIIEYPRKGIFAVVFISSVAKDEMKQKLPKGEKDDGYISVFLPTTPNPTSGFLLFVRESEITYLDMKVEDAAKLVISAGLVYPEVDSQSELNKALKKVNEETTRKIDAR